MIFYDKNYRKYSGYFLNIYYGISKKDGL